MADFKLQYLKHGKSLCGKVFGTFVETFNRLVDFQANLKGDGDVSGDGLVTVDRADPAHPVIRLDRSKLPAGGGEGDDGSASKADRSCFRLEQRQQGEDKSELMLVCCYYHVGGITKHMADMSVESLLPPQVATGGDGGEGELNPWLLCLKLSGAAAQILSIEESSLESEQRSADLYILPLYRFLGRKLQDDLRNAPNIQQWELDLT